MSTQSEFIGSGSATFRDRYAGGGWVKRERSGDKKEERGRNIRVAAKQNVPWTLEFPYSHKKLYGPICAISHNVFVKKTLVQNISLKDKI